MTIHIRIGEQWNGPARLLSVACIVAALIFGMTASSAQASSARPDRSFGKNGRVIGHELPLVDMANLPDGRTVVATETTLYAYRSNGRPDHRFGKSGAVTPFAPEGRRVGIAGIAIDGHDRILVAGGAEHIASTANAGDATSYAAVERYLPSGKLDPQFGNGGAVITDFGFPAPTRPANIPDYAQVSLPVDVDTRGIAVDSRERIVVTGTRATTYHPAGKSTPILAPAPEAFVARLTPGGNQDPAFDRTGTLSMPGLISIGKPAIDLNDGVFFVTSQDGAEFEEPPLAQVIGHLTAGGTPDPNFANAGWRSLPVDTRFGSEFNSSITLDPQGRLLLSGLAHLGGGDGRLRATGSRVGSRIERFRANGSLDRTFGHGGVTTITSQAGQVSLNGLAVTDAGRILAAGALRSESTSGKSEPTWRLLVVGLTRNGGFDRSFGRSGAITTSFGAKAAPEGQAVLVDANGRAVVGGTANYGPRPPARFFLARYLLAR